jgi:3-phenylpropionate/trans-cinnamate dioxygenase ferredoxin reductase subunit
LPGPCDLHYPLGVSDPIAVVGASVAGVRLIQSLRAAGVDAPLVLIDTEPGDPYDKPALSKEYLVATEPPAAGRHVLITAAELERIDVGFRPGSSAAALDPEAHLLTLDGGETLRYSRLVIASGARARTMPAFEGVPGSFTLRSRDDALVLRNVLREGPRLVVVGGGFIGSEVAAAACKHGSDVTIMEAADRMAGRVFAPEAAAHMQSLHESRGVKVRLGVSVAGPVIDGGRLTGVQLADGSVVDCDAAVIGIGSVPRTDWLESSGLELDDGIQCDAQLRAVGAEDVWAIGDVARWPDPDLGYDVRHEHWTGARQQAGFVAAQLAGRDVGLFRTMPYVWTDQHDSHIQHAGVTDSAARVLAEHTQAGTLYRYIRDDKTVAVTGFDAVVEVAAFRQGKLPETHVIAV